MNSDKKESIAITAIINEVNQFDNIQESLKKKDKEPVWDGELTLYQAQSNKSNEIMGRIPVQVKGIGQDIDQKEGTLDYRVKISDIENYKKDKKGAIFFVVEVFENRETAIYYKTFDLETIDDILKSITTKQITKKFQFKRLEKNQLVSICIDFIDKLNIYESIVPIKKVEVYDKKILCYDYNTKYELEEMKKANEVFFETNSYQKAKKKLEEQNVIILHGEPWVGKTSTARKLVMNYIEQGYIFLYGNVDDLVEIKNKVAMEGKMICLLDDFLGSNVQYLEKNVAESTLDKIIAIFKNSKDKKLILTSRTYIYNNCKQLFYKFYHATGIKDEYLIDVADYNYLEKGNILYNHLQKNGLLATEQYEQILDAEFYEHIIEHPNFNPGVISLICERMKNKKNIDLKEYIRDMLGDPEGLWEEEYQKLTSYEKIILIIIVLFEVKVPEEYVEEQFQQIMKQENIQLVEEDTFAKAMDKLTVSFIKVTFNEDEEREVQVCKHSIADFIISKIRKGQVDIERYIKSANYVEVLNYIDTILEASEEKKVELLAQKVEKDFKKIQSFYYDKETILYHILERKVTPKREEILKQIILQAFESYDIDLILSILENETNVLYDFTLKMFKKYIIDQYEEEYLYRIQYVGDYETYLQICLKIVNYQKNSDYAMANLADIEESLIEVISEDVKATIEDVMMENVAEDIIKGKTLEQIEKEYIEEVAYDEIPSLRKLYSKNVFKGILELLYECCYINIEEEELQETIKSLKNNKEETTNNGVEENRIETKAKQKKYIQEKFRKASMKQKETKEEQIDYKEFARKSMFEIHQNWWQNSFVKYYFNYWDNCEEYVSLVAYYEFVKENTQIDTSLAGLAKQFLAYIYQKYAISQKADNILREIIYRSFIKGSFQIQKAILEEYETKYPSIMKKIYETNLIEKQIGMVINEYIYLFIALEEVKQKQDDLLRIMVDWMRKSFHLQKEKLIDHKERIFQLYAEIDRIAFYKRYLIPLLEYFILEIQKKARTKGKMGRARAIVDMFSFEIELDETFDKKADLSYVNIFSWMMPYVIGNEIERDIGQFDYSIYQKQFYQKCYNFEQNTYLLDFKKILKDKELRDICASLKIWDYLYDVYLICIEVLEKLQENPQIDSYHIARRELKEKYDI